MKVESSEDFFSTVNNKRFLLLNKFRQKGDLWFLLISSTLENYQAFLNENEKDHIPFKKIF